MKEQQQLLKEDKDLKASALKLFQKKHRLTFTTEELGILEDALNSHTLKLQHEALSNPVASDLKSLAFTSYLILDKVRKLR